MTQYSTETDSINQDTIHKARRSSATLQADILALLVLAVLTLLFFWKITLTNRVLAGLDVFAYFYPYRDFASETLRAGHLPLWNPYLFMGAPLLANSQVAALYPLHWPLVWSSVPKQVAWSIALHVWLAGAGLYLFARRSVHLRPVPAGVASVAFALSGFLGAQVEHLNQLNTSVWFPWLLLCLDATLGAGRWRWPARVLGAGLVGLILLAGHTQSAYIVLFGTGVYALFRSAGELKRREWLPVLKRLGTLALWSMVGVVMALAQLLPTLELSRLSVRSGGLPYQEAASFSLKPGLIFKALLPPLLWPPPFSEYVTYIGLTGLALAAVALWAAWRRRPHQAGQAVGLFLALACVGIFLALGAYNPVYYLLYRLVPGFDLFRAPARWLLFYSLGAAVLAGLGLQMLPSLAGVRSGLARQLRSVPVLLAIAVLLVIELFAAGRRLAYNQPTAPAAYDSLRSAPSHLLADAQQPTEDAAQVVPSKGAPQHPQDLFRFLSMSDIQYDPGDMGDLQAMYANDLPEESIYHLIVATKMKEVLAYNLPLVYRLFSVDGYDGGLLPIQNYVTLERLFLPEEEIWPDGRLRQQLRTVPPARLLSLLNVKYVITDKTQDAWIDDAFYDLEHTVPLGRAELDDLPGFATTHLGVVSYLSGASSVQDGTVVAQVVITGNAAGPVSYTLPLVAGTHTAEGLYGAQPVAHRRARVGHFWRDNESGSDYIARLELPEPMLPTAIRVEGLLPHVTLYLRGLTLLDKESGTSRNLSIDPAYKLVHSGDVKVYQNLSVLPRAFAVHQARVVAGDEQALELLRDPALDPAETVILSSGTELDGEHRDGLVRITHYQPEHVEIRIDLEEPGYLVLTDTYYPGWSAELDGQRTPIHRANLYFRAVSVPAGEHQVIFRYQPAGLGLGLTVSLAAWGLWLTATLVAFARIGRKHPSHV